MRLSSACLAVLLLASLPAGAKTVLLSDEQRAFVEDHGPFTVLLGPTGPPLGFLGDDGTVQGIQPDFFQLITINLGVTFNITVANSTTAIVDALANRTYDVVGPVLKTPERDASHDLLGPIYWSRVGFWVSERIPEVSLPHQLTGRRVAVPGAGFLPHLNEKYPGLVIVSVTSAAEAVDRLVSGDVDAVYAGYTSVGYIARNRDLEGLRTLGEPDQIVESFWATPAEEPLVGSILELGWNSLEGQPRLNVYLKWTGLDLGPPPAQPAAFWATTGFQSTVGAALAIVVVLAILLFLLRAEVKRRTRELRASEARLRALVESTPIGVASVTPDGRLESISAALMRLVGGGPGMRPRTLRSIVDAADWPAFERLHEAMRDGSVDQYARDAQLRTMSGTRVACHWSAAALRDERGKLEAVALMVEDFTPRLRTERENRVPTGMI